MNGVVSEKPDAGAASIKIGITLSGKDLDDARRVLTKIVAQSNPASPTGVVSEGCWLPFETDPARQELLRRAQTALDNRRRRAQIFRRGMFGEPAWEMLLVLYVGDPRHPQSIGNLSESAGVNGTTALRWLDVLEGDQLIRRENHPFDKRSVLIHLTDKAREAMDLYFSETGLTGI